MTETEVMGRCLGKALASQPKGFGSSEAKAATDVATSLFKADKCDGDTFGRVIARLGNHSALRQWAIQHGFITVENDALANAVSEEIARLKEVEAEAMDEITKK